MVAYATGTESKRTRLEKLRAQLDLDRSTFMAQYRELSDYLLPNRPRFLTTDQNRGERKNYKIIDSTGTMALRTLASGMMAGVTSPARPWFRLTAPDPDLSEVGPVKEWLHQVTQRMRSVFLRSNLYHALPNLYGDLGGFGTSPLMIEEDFDDVVRFRVFPVGSYMVASDARGRVTVFFREFRMTVRQIVEEFATLDPETGEVIDFGDISLHVRELWKKGQTEVWIDVCHVIMPNESYDDRKAEAKYKRYKSCYYEKGHSGAQQGNYMGASQDEDKLLRESGYDRFPVLCPRWHVVEGDVYATDCPGMVAIGDTKALQIMQKRKAQAIDKSVNPAMVAPAFMEKRRPSILPGDITYIDETSERKFRAAHEVSLNLDHLRQDILEHQQRIRRAFFEDLFLMLAQTDRRQITAREIEERHEEKLLALGPVLEQLNQDLLDPMIDHVFDIMLRQGLIPEPPQEIQGMRLKVVYESVLAQAQKAVGLAGLDRFAMFAGGVARVAPEVLDMINGDELIEEYAEATGMPPRIIRDKEHVAEIRRSRAKAQAMQAAPTMAKEGATAAKALSETKLEDDSALKRLLEAAQAGQLVDNAA